MCRDHILNIKDAPPPKPAGKGAKRTIEQATAAPPPPPPAAAPAPPSSDTPAQAPALEPVAEPAAEAGPSADGSEIKEQQGVAASQEQPDTEAAQEQEQEQQSLGVVQEAAQTAAQTAGSALQAGSDAAASTVQVDLMKLCFSFSCMSSLLSLASSGVWVHCEGMLQKKEAWNALNREQRVIIHVKSAGKSWDLAPGLRSRG